MCVKHLTAYSGVHMWAYSVHITNLQQTCCCWLPTRRCLATVLEAGVCLESAEINRELCNSRKLILVCCALRVWDITFYQYMKRWYPFLFKFTQWQAYIWKYCFICCSFNEHRCQEIRLNLKCIWIGILRLRHLIVASQLGCVPLTLNNSSLK